MAALRTSISSGRVHNGPLERNASMSRIFRVSRFERKSHPFSRTDSSRCAPSASFQVNVGPSWAWTASRSARSDSRRSDSSSISRVSRSARVDSSVGYQEHSCWPGVQSVHANQTDTRYVFTVASAAHRAEVDVREGALRASRCPRRDSPLGRSDGGRESDVGVRCINSIPVRHALIPMQGQRTVDAADSARLDGLSLWPLDGTPTRAETVLTLGSETSLAPRS